jgi:hypothetical protein
MSYDANIPVKKYDRDLGRVIPNVRICPSERPRLDTGPAPYLPLQFENDRHDEFYVILTGKVVALDDRGFIVPAGLAYQLQILEDDMAVQAGLGATMDLSTARTPELDLLWRYDATDVANGVVNARGEVATLNEPVVLSFITWLSGAVQQRVQYDESVALGAASTAIPLDNPPTPVRTFDIGRHIGFAPYSMLRAASDVMERALNENELHPAAASGPEALKPYSPTQLRNLAWELQNKVTVLVANECMEYPVAADRTGVLLEGQVIAIGAMADFVNGGYVTFDHESDIVPVTNTCLAVSQGTPDWSAVGAAADALASIAMLDLMNRIVGQVVRKSTRYPSSYLDKVRTRWETSIQGFDGLDRMPGTATSGYPWHMHTAGSTLGTVQISPLMR